MSNYAAAARALGVSRDGNLTALDLSDRVRRGLPVTALNRLVSVVSPKDAGLKYRIVPKASLARRKSGTQLSQAESERLARLAQVWGLALEVWRDEEAARDFLNRPHMMLRDRTPLEVSLESDIGARAVEDVLSALLYGSAA